MPPSTDLETFKDAFAKSTRVAILTGAGLSAGSGIPTYRGTNGIWKNHDHDILASVKGFKDDPVAVWQFHQYMRQIAGEASPNAAHRALASLSIPGIRARLLPALKDPDTPPLYITQNVDNLCPRALDDLKDVLTSEEMEKARAQLIEMHGNVFRQVCLQCRHISTSADHSLAHSAIHSPDPPIEVRGDKLPRCGGPDWKGSNRYGRCGGLLRPDVVWFGEIPDGMGDIGRYLNWTDMLIVVGTSSLVYPAAGYCKTVKDRGGKVAVFNYDASPADEMADFLFLGKCEEVLPTAFGMG